MNKPVLEVGQVWVPRKLNTRAALRTIVWVKNIARDQWPYGIVIGWVIDPSKPVYPVGRVRPTWSVLPDGHDSYLSQARFHRWIAKSEARLLTDLQREKRCEVTSAEIEAATKLLTDMGWTVTPPLS